MDGTYTPISEYFGCNTFSFEQMEKKLLSSDVALLKGFATSRTALPRDLAEKVAVAVKEWAISRGATHYCHWFQPQTGATAEKHDSFFSFDLDSKSIERFDGSMLIQSEPDASSFPSGGSRTTFEARGYTVWDASSPMFLMDTENGTTLCIPSLFISYLNGEALDNKTPLLRSQRALDQAALEALKLFGDDVEHVITTAGPEQEYFVIDEALYYLRPDLILAGRTLLGRTPPRHQQLEDHYFGSIKPRILAYMMECEHELYKLGVPCKTRHNEVAPGQCETAPVYEQANVAADHNQLVMEIHKSVARRHGLVTLFHEKPYAGVNGSGKHVNWSLRDSQGRNILKPGPRPHENVRFLYFLAAVIKTISENGDILRMSVASPGNDFRLGANEAPPAIMSIFLGDALTRIIDTIVDGKDATHTVDVEEINLCLSNVPVIKRDNTDRNRTSPFAFVGNRFEFRAQGSSGNIAGAITYLNGTFAYALKEMNQALRTRYGNQPTDAQILELIRDVLKEHRRVIFNGNGYAEEWHQEAEKRGLVNLKTTVEALQVLKYPKVSKIMSEMEILSEAEVKSRYNIHMENYIKVRLIELETLRELIATHVYPGAMLQLEQYARAAQAVQSTLATAPKPLIEDMKKLTELTNSLGSQKARLDTFIEECSQHHEDLEAVAGRLATEGMELLSSLRAISNELELIVDDHLWSLPKYREMMYYL
jgi:glutamine synthetase